MRARRLAWTVFGVSTALSASGLVLLAQVPARLLERADNSFALSALFVAILLVFGLVGAIVASRLPANPIGWLFLALALIQGVYELAFGYTHYALDAGPGGPPGEQWTAWVANWTSPLSPPFLAAALLLFPDGRPPTPRWRWVPWLCAPLFGVIFARYAFAPGPIEEFPALVNPVGVEGAGWLADLVTSSLAQAVLGDAADEDSILAGFVFAACISGVPLSAGIAILRHRLYDIDLVIRRTLVYVVLTATLGATYLAAVLLLGLAVGESGFAVAVSTLAVAAIFRPLRARIQAAVDRRFYRRRYDAARTLEAFGGRLRDELDLEALAADVRGVVNDTVQPAHVSLWLRSRS